MCLYGHFLVSFGTIKTLSPFLYFLIKSLSSVESSADAGHDLARSFVAGWRALKIMQEVELHLWNTVTYHSVGRLSELPQCLCVEPHPDSMHLLC